MTDHLNNALRQAFGIELATLSTAARVLIHSDFRTMAIEDFDVDDATVDEFINRENLTNAAREYKRRIGAGNLSAYAASLHAGELVRQKQQRGTK